MLNNLNVVYSALGEITTAFIWIDSRKIAIVEMLLHPFTSTLKERMKCWGKCRAHSLRQTDIGV